MQIIGIETSHDDTSIALLVNGQVQHLITYSQVDTHAKYGGVIPELASREHVNNIALVLDELLKRTSLDDIDYVAYTSEPGLIGPLHMGRLFAYGLAKALNVPIVPINHLVGHIYAGAIAHQIRYPALALLASGGHTQLLWVQAIDQITTLGTTQDDAVGEAFDKVGRVLKLPFPGGPAIDALYNRAHQLQFAVAMRHKGLDFSYSGLKSKVINYLHQQTQKNQPIDVQEVASAFQTSAIKQLISKTQQAIKQYQPQSIILGGGVAANMLLRAEFKKLHDCVIIPDFKYATDNGAMIAKAAEVWLMHQEKRPKKASK